MTKQIVVRRLQIAKTVVIQTQSQLRAEESNVRSFHLPNRWVWMTVLLFSLLFSFLIGEAYAELRSGMDADIVVGQPNFSSVAANQGGGPDANTLNSPRNAHFDGNQLFIADRSNQRILVYNSIPQSSNAPADFVIGQPDFTTNALAAVSASSFNDPHHAFSDGKRLYVADRGNERVVIFNQIPAHFGAAADVAVGQPDLNSQGANNGGLSARSIGDTFGVHAANDRLFVADRSNNRVLIFNKIPTAHHTPADVVIGQPNFTSNGVNQGGAVGPNTLEWPYFIVTVGEKLVIVDRSNHRVLIYNQVPTENNTNADVVIGQPDFFSDQRNQGGEPRSNSLGTPAGLFTDGKRLFIAEDTNHRVLVYNSIPTVNGAPADIVLGQADFNSDDQNRGGGPAANTMSGAYGLSFGGRYLFVAERNNHRVLVFNLAKLNTEELGPQFSQGKAVVGKVYWDMNADGIQQSGKG